MKKPPLEMILFKQNYTTVFKSVFIFCGNYHLAEDATQEAFLQAFKSLHTLKDPDKFSSWVYIIATNIVKSNYKKDKRVTKISLEKVDNICSFTDEYCNIELREDIKQLLNNVSEEEKKSLTLFYIDGLSVKEISELTQTKITTIKVRLHRARERLKRHVDKESILEDLR